MKIYNICESEFQQMLKYLISIDIRIENNGAKKLKDTC